MCCSTELRLKMPVKGKSQLHGGTSCACYLRQGTGAHLGLKQVILGRFNQRNAGQSSPQKYSEHGALLLKKRVCIPSSALGASGCLKRALRACGEKLLFPQSGGKQKLRWTVHRDKSSAPVLAESNSIACFPGQYLSSLRLRIQSDRPRAYL